MDENTAPTVTTTLAELALQDVSPGATVRIADEVFTVTAVKRRYQPADGIIEFALVAGANINIRDAVADDDEFAALHVGSRPYELDWEDGGTTTLDPSDVIVEYQGEY